MPSPYPERNWPLGLGVTCLIIVAIWFVVFVSLSQFLPPPKLTELTPVVDTLANPVLVYHPAKGGPWASVPMEANTGRISDLCFLGNCELTLPLRSLKQGDRVMVWMHEGRIWQLSRDNEILLPYDEIIAGEKRRDNRHYLIMSAIGSASLLLLLWGLARKRSNN